MIQKNTIFASYIKSIFLLIVISLITACASGVSNTVKVTDDDMAKFNAMSSEEAVADLEKSLQEARSNDLPLYTPSFFKEAESLYNSAQKSLAKKKNKAEIIRDIAKADRLLSRAKIKKFEAETELKELFTINQKLIELAAPSAFKSEYESLNKDLNKLIVKIETNKTDKIDKDKSKLLKKFETLEVKVIKYAALHEAKEIREQAKAKNAQKLAPKTYAEAVEAYQTSDATITQNPHDETKVAEAKKQALFAARHALSVTKRVPKLEQEYKKLPERVIIEEEKRIYLISNATNKADYRDKPILDQIDLIISSIKTLNKENEDNAKNIETISNLEKQLKEKNVSLVAANEALAKIKTELTDRNNQLLTMTADLIHLQNIEKQLNGKIAQLKTKPAPVKEEESMPGEKAPVTEHEKKLEPAIHSDIKLENKPETTSSK